VAWAWFTKPSTPRSTASSRSSFCRKHLSDDAAEKLRFIHEAKAASALDHPNICVIHEIGEIDGGQLLMQIKDANKKAIEFLKNACYIRTPIDGNEAISGSDLVMKTD
jgi:hypothetical protein